MNRQVSLVALVLLALAGTSADAIAQQADATASANVGATIVAAMGIVTNTSELNLGSDATVSGATFSVTGRGGATYAIMLPSVPETATRTHAADAISITVFSSLPSGTGQLNPDGARTIYLGGTLNLAKSLPPGVYTGSFDVTIAYN
jgi:hypothetical protein